MGSGSISDVRVLNQERLIGIELRGTLPEGA
jgi:hypothetical protein